MNLAVRRFLFFFFATTLLASCEDASEIGIDLQDKNQIGTNYTDTLTITTGTVLLNDSILSFRVVPVQAGQYADPVLGTVKATTYTELALGGSSVKFGDNPVADSAVLTLDYGAIYGNQSAPLTLEVHRLTEGFQEKASYFTTSTLAYESEPLGTVTFQPRLTKVKSGNTEVDSATIARVKLSPAFASELVAQSGQSTFTNQDNFNNFLKGIALVPTGQLGNIVGFKPNSAKTRITLYYKAGAEQKTHVFGISEGQRFFTNVQTDRTGTALASLDQKGEYIPATATGGESYIQTNSQLLTKIEIPYLLKLKELEGDIVLNRAELVIPVKKGSTAAVAAPPVLALFPTNSSNRILKTSAGAPITVQKDALGSVDRTDNPAALAYDAKRGQYALNITPYVQALLLGKKENLGLLLAPVRISTNSQTGASGTSTETAPYRAIISNTGEDQVKLLLYFSKLK
ncbi:DUF4270 family protein [Pontibacter liquoris]|uniref:DUF4270 family protein n=1 Tax=Pontibacter liquoris TaxID=2905677 RepID=UPI001FA6B4C1|nr:DUF4270 family protein [Pontibacter liquoris]